MRPTLYAKSSLYADNIAHKIDLGCDGIEIQLLQELYNGNNAIKISSIFDVNTLCDYPIKVIHAPIKRVDGTQFNLEEYMLNPTYNSIFEDVCRFANKCSRNGEKIGVIVHAYNHLEYLRETHLIVKIVTALDRVLSCFPNVNILIENSTIVHGTGSSGLDMVNTYYAVPELVRELRKVLKTDRIGSVLDICHANISCSISHAIWGESYPTSNPLLTLYDYFYEFKDTCMLIHLASYKGTGLTPGDHGISFTDETAGDCHYALSLYKEFGYKCPITIEVAEKDYLNCVGYAKTKDIVMDYYGYK